jgi:raffinose/stachyose/melibiose transport system substrate-binding protein
MKKVLKTILAFLFIGAAAFAGGASEEAAKKPVTLNLLFYSPELSDQYKDMVAAYKTETGVTLDITVLQADYRSVLTSKINSGDIPDVFMSSAYADNSTYKDYVYDLSNEDFIKKISPSALQGVTVGGKIIGYPFLVQSHSFIYNKKIFADLGISELPKTLPEFEAVAKKIEAAGIQPFATGFKEFWVLPQTAWQALAPVVVQNYGGYEKFVAALNAGTLKFKDIPEMSAVFDLLDLIKKYGGPKPNESNFNDQTSSIATGKVAIIHQGNWAEGTILKTNPDAQIGFLVGPVGGTLNWAAIMFDSNQLSAVAKDTRTSRPPSTGLRWLTTPNTAKTGFRARSIKCRRSPARPPRIPYRRSDRGKHNGGTSAIRCSIRCSPPHRAATRRDPAGILRRQDRPGSDARRAWMRRMPNSEGREVISLLSIESGLSGKFERLFRTVPAASKLRRIGRMISSQRRNGIGP